jgi:hypothetical protein
LRADLVETRQIGCPPRRYLGHLRFLATNMDGVDMAGEEGIGFAGVSNRGGYADEAF